MDQLESNEKSQTISACLIVKNEEKLLAQCLDSINNIVDEIIIVDTGSTDRTVEIAKKYTDKIYFHEWQNSFSEARNYSIQQATCEWIMIIDADEKFEKEDTQLLRSATKNKRFNSIYAVILSDLPSGVSKHYSQRIFQRGKGYYDGIVHNQLVCEGDALVTDIRFYHYGYNLNPEQMKKKFKRTEELLKKQLNENPEYLFGWMNLVRIYKCQELWDNAIKTAQMIINEKKEAMDPTTYQMIAYDMAYSFFSKKDYDNAEKTCTEILKSYPNNLDTSFLSGSVSICKGNYQRAIHNYMHYLNISEEKADINNFSNLIVDTHASQGQAWNNIGSAYAELGQPDKAINAYKKAISFRQDPIYYENLSRIYFRQKRFDEMIKVIEDADSLGIATGNMLAQLAETYYTNGKTNDAITYFRKAIDFDKTVISHQLNLARILVFNNKIKDAQDILKSAISSIGESPLILHNLAIIAIKLNEIDEVNKYIERIMAMDSIDAEFYLSMGNDWLKIDEHKLAMPFYEKCLQAEPDNSSALINLATCYAKLGMYESAIIGYRSALAKNPNDPTIIRNLLVMKKIIESEYLSSCK